MANAMRQWLDSATKEQAIRLAKISKTSLGVLRQIAGGYRTNGRASTTPETAKALELASYKLEGVAPLKREQLCTACARCEYVKTNKEKQNGCK